MKIAMTGSTGFIGYHLLRRLLAEGYTVYALIRKNSDRSRLPVSKNIMTFDGGAERLEDYFKERSVEGIIHLASLFISKHRSEDISNLIDSNIKYGTWLIESAVQSNVRWFINTGTIWQHYNDAEYNPVNLYAATKQAFEAIAEYYIQTTDLNFVTLKINDTFGPQDIRPKVFSLWDKIAESGEKLSMSAGEQLMDVSFVADVVDSFMMLIGLMQKNDARNHCGKSYFVRSQQQVSLRTLSEIFEQISHKKLNIKWGNKPYREREVMRPCRAGEVVPGWKPTVTLKDGIKKTYGSND
jgi:nucleoside-diphosphate-sugar epimerase